MMNQSEDDDHSGQQKEIRSSRLCNVVNVVILIIGFQVNEILTKKHWCLLS